MIECQEPRFRRVRVPIPPGVAPPLDHKAQERLKGLAYGDLGRVRHAIQLYAPDETTALVAPTMTGAAAHETLRAIAHYNRMMEIAIYGDVRSYVRRWRFISWPAYFRGWVDATPWPFKPIDVENEIAVELRNLYPDVKPVLIESGTTSPAVPVAGTSRRYS